MIYEVEISEQDDNDLRGIFECIAFNYNHRKMQADNLTVWKNKY